MLTMSSGFGKVAFSFLITSPCLIGSGCIGTVHGFALRPNLNVPDVKAAYEGSLDQTVAWFKKTL
jgi:hypothetical protein